MAHDMLYINRHSNTPLIYLIKDCFMIVLMNNRKDIRDLINTVNDHYYACSKLIKKTAYDTIYRSVSRFITLERSLLDELIPFDDEKVTLPFAVQNLGNTPTFRSYREMLQANRELIKYLTHMTSVIENVDVSSLISYWTAAMQIECDDIAARIESEQTIQNH